MFVNGVIDLYAVDVKSFMETEIPQHIHKCPPLAHIGTT
jgi:hypothetical protein